ncbi:MAG: hypothetical protein ACI9G1_005637, partial [Pirellulaceae bacterium]
NIGVPGTDPGELDPGTGGGGQLGDDPPMSDDDLSNIGN